MPAVLAQSGGVALDFSPPKARPAVASRRAGDVADDDQGQPPTLLKLQQFGEVRNDCVQGQYVPVVDVWNSA